MTRDLQAQLELLEVALPDFLGNESDHAKFEAMDWMLKVLSAKWDAYAIERRLCLSDE